MRRTLRPSKQVALVIALALLTIVAVTTSFVVLDGTSSDRASVFIGLVGTVTTICQPLVALRRRRTNADGATRTDAGVRPLGSEQALGIRESRAAIARRTEQSLQAGDRDLSRYVELDARRIDDDVADVARVAVGDEHPAMVPPAIGLLGTERRVVLLGEPGSGKSTCLRHIARQTIVAMLASPDAPIPLYASLATWSDPTISAAEFLRREFIARYGDDNHYARNFAAALRAGQIKLLIDGLNELPSRAPRRCDQIIGKPRGSAEHSSGGSGGIAQPRGRSHVDVREQSLRSLAVGDAATCSIVLTCRTHEYDQSFERDSSDWVTIELVAMGPQQIETFIAAHRPRSAPQVLSAIRSNSVLAGLATNPFLLRSIIELDLDTLDKIEDKAHLVAQLMRQSIDRSRINSDDNADVDVVGSLGGVAYRMVRQWMIGNQCPLALHSYDERAAAERLASTPFIVRREGDYFFQHQIVQEYLAARWLANRRAARRPIQLLLDRRWSEIVVLWIQLRGAPAARAVRRSLRARNYPWRRPRRVASPAVSVLDLLVGMCLFGFLAAAAASAILGPAKTLRAPTAWLDISPWSFMLAIVGLRMVIKSLAVHGSIAGNAAYSLAVARDAVSIRPIFRSFRSTLQKERSDIATSLAGMGHIVIEHCEKGLSSRRFRVRAGAVLTLGATAERFPELRADVRPLLRGAASTDDPRLVIPAIAAIVRAGDPELGPSLERLLRTIESMNPLLVGVRFQPLTTMLQPETFEWSPVFVASLRNILSPERAIHTLLPTIATADALRVPGLERELQAVALAETADARARSLAIRALGGSRSTVAPMMIEDLATRYPYASAVGEAVRRLDPDIDAHLVTLVRLSAHPSMAVRTSVAVALGTSSKRARDDVVRDLLGDSEATVRVAALGACREHEDLILEVFPSAVSDDDEAVRQAALDALCARVTAARLDALRAVAHDVAHRHRVPATRHLAEFGVDATYTLRQLSGSPVRRVRRVARLAMRQIAWSDSHSTARPSLSRITDVRSMVLGPLIVLRALLRDERLAGTPKQEMIQHLNLRLLGDANLMRRYRSVVTVLAGALLSMTFVVAVLGIAAGRLGVWLGVLCLRHLVIAAAVGLAGGACGVMSNRMADGPASTVASWITGIVVAAGVVVLIGALFFVWWVPVGIGVASTIVAFAVIAIRSGRRRVSPDGSPLIPLVSPSAWAPPKASDRAAPRGASPEAPTSRSLPAPRPPDAAR